MRYTSPSVFRNAVSSQLVTKVCFSFMRVSRYCLRPSSSSLSTSSSSSTGCSPVICAAAGRGGPAGGAIARAERWHRGASGNELRAAVLGVNQLHGLLQAAAAELRATGAEVLAVPLLIESGTYRQRVRRLCVVDCPEAVQIARVMQRSGLEESQVRAIMAAQASRAERLAAADDVVDNGGTPAQLVEQVERLHGVYLRLAARGGAV